MVLVRMFYLWFSCRRSPLSWNLGNTRHAIIAFFLPYEKKIYLLKAQPFSQIKNALLSDTGHY